jgi:hypothetical protein
LDDPGGGRTGAGPGAGRLDFQFPGDLTIQFQDGASSRRNPKETILRGMKPTKSKAKSGRLSTSDLPGDQGNGPQTDGIIDPVRYG